MGLELIVSLTGVFPLDGGKLLGDSPPSKSPIMKTFSIIASVLVGLPLVASAQSAAQKFQEACKSAAENKKDVMVVFTGTSWSKQSQSLEEQILKAEVFKKETDKLFTKLTFDFPREREKTDRALLEFQMKFMVRQLPSFLLLDSAGRPFGYSGLRKGGPEDYVKHLQELVALRVKRDELFAKGRATKGVEGAKLLIEGLELLPGHVIRDFYVLELADIAKADPKGETGYIAKIEKAEALKREQAYYQALFREKKYEEIIKVSTKAAQEASGEDSQRLSLYKIQALATLERFEEANNAIIAMASIVPESELGKRAPQYHQAVSRMKARTQKMKQAKASKPVVRKKTGPIVSKPVAIVSDINVLKKEAVMLEKQALEAAKNEEAIVKKAAAQKTRIATLEKELAQLKKDAENSKGESEKATAERVKLATKAKAMKEVIENHEAMEARKRQMSKLEKNAKDLKKEAEALRGKAKELKKPGK